MTGLKWPWYAVSTTPEAPMRTIGSSLTILALLIMGCAGSGDSATDTSAGQDVIESVDPGQKELPTFEENPAHVLFDLFADPVESPFPYDYYKDPVQGGIRIRAGAFTNKLLPVIHTFSEFVKQFSEIDGFATYAPIAFLSSVPLDPTTLPQDEETTLQPDSPLRLLELDDAGVPVGPVRFRIEYREMDSQDGIRYVVSAVPMEMLKPGTTYLYVVTDRIQSESGETLGPSRGFAEILGSVDIRPGDPERVALLEKERERLTPLVLQLDDVAHVIAAVDFTTGMAGDETYGIMSLFEKGGAFQAVDWNMDGNNDGTDDLSWGDQYKECKMSSDDLAYGIYGSFENVNFTGKDNYFLKEGSEWKTFTPEELEFWLMVPVGDGPFPVVVMTHGIASDEGQLCKVSREMIQAGIATVRFVLPRHGRRGGGQMDFLDLTNPFKTRDNFRQGSADIASTTLLIETLSEELDLLPKDAPNGQGDLDSTRIGLLGHSLGAIIGAHYLAFSDRIHAAVLNVGGVGLTHMVESYVLPEGSSGGFYEVMGLVLGAPHLIWSADGVTYAHHINKEPLSAAHSPKHILAHEHMNDGTVPNVTTELLARFGSIPILEPPDMPVIKPVTGVPSVPHDQTTSGVWQVDGVGHGDFPGSEGDPKIALTRKQAVHYFRTFFDTGTPEIIAE